MNTIKIAWRNIWRNKLRSLAVICSVLLGLFAGLFTSALVQGMMDGRFKNFIEKEISHIQVHHPDFIGQHEVYQTTGKDLNVLQQVLALNGVKSATVRSKIQSMLASATYTGGVELIGINPTLENITTSFADNLVEGEFLADNDRNSILIGKSMANKMKVKVGSRVVLTFQNTNNDIISAAFVVKGFFETYYKRYDESTAFVNIRHLNEHIGIGNEFHELALLAIDEEVLDELVPALSKLFPGMRVRKWNEVSPELSLWVEVGDIFSLIFTGIIMIGLAFGLLNTMLMAVFERTRELGMLMAIGMNKIKIFSLIVYETLALSLVGACLGMVTGLLVVMALKEDGIDLSAFSDVMKEIGFETMIYPEMNMSFFWILPIIVITTALLSAIYPAKKALRLNPAEAVKN